MSTLHQYIKAQPERPMREWAEAFGISRPHLIMLIDGTRAPSLPVARRIQDQTGGAVPITVWPNLAAVIDAANEGAA
jgi:plasmid maintenance system antidote protein VapI